jgi:hypothetical protein
MILMLWPPIALLHLHPEFIHLLFRVIHRWVVRNFDLGNIWHIQSVRHQADAIVSGSKYYQLYGLKHL